MQQCKRTPPWLVLLLMLIIAVTIPLLIETAAASPYIPPLSEYGNVTSFHFNITPGMGAQTDYQVTFILSNLSGVSGYYAPDNIIYTNGTTRPDWYDTNATDESDNPLAFWPWNNTATAHNITVTVKVPSIAVGNTSVGKWYYGAPAQNGSTMDMMGTFPELADDMLSSSYNTTKWPYISASGGSLSQSSGEMNITATGAANYGVNTSNFLAGNYSIIARVKQPATATLGLSNFGWRGITNTPRAIVRLNIGNIASLNNAGSDSVTNISTTGTTYNVYDIKRNSTSSIIITVNHTVTYDNFLQVPPSTLPQAIYTYNGVSTVIDWLAVPKSVPIEPVTSLYTTSRWNGADIVASFTHLPDPSSVDAGVVFTDTSTGSPVTWNWTFHDGNTSTEQNPIHAFPGVGNYYVDLNVTNSTGSFSNYTALHTVSSATAPLAMYTQDRTVLIFTRSVQFTDSSTNNPTGWNWSFGDDTYSEVQNVSHQFVKRGRWTVTLNASNAAGYSTNTSTVWILGG